VTLSTYRVGGKMEWSAQSGQAIIALQNFNGSGRKVTVQRIDVDVLTSCQGASGAILRGQQFVQVQRGTLGGGGEPVAFTENDTNSSALPAQVTAWTLAGLDSPSTLGRLYINRNFTAVGFNDAASMVQHGKLATLLGKRGMYSSSLEAYVLREGECLALVPSNDRSTVPMEVSADVRVGTRCYTLRCYTWALCGGLSMLSINNGTGSGVVVEVLNIRLSELGSTDTPYLQVVPVGSIDPAAIAPAMRLTPIKNDTASPTLDTAKVAAFANVAILPSGVPQSYIQESSAGTPKGFNYLHTKDFAGPVYRVCFPELRVGATELFPDGGPYFLRQINLLGTKNNAGVVLRPGEGIAVCSAAENATGSVVGVSAWTSLEIWLTITDEPLIAPSVTLTGLATGAVVAVVQQNTETLIEVLAESGGSVTYNYTANPGTFVDFNILAAGKTWQQLADFELVEAIQSIPITQTTDLVYDGATSEGVTFSGSTKRIVADTGNTTIDVQALYSEWVDWALLGSNLRFFPAFQTQGGSDIDPGAGTSIPFYVYLINSWRVRPQEASHTLNVTGGVILVDGGGDPFVDTLGSYVVRVNYQQPVQAIVVNTSGTVAPSQAQIQTAVRAELTTEMARLDVAVSTRSTPAQVTAAAAAVNVETINLAEVIGDGTAGNAWRGVGVPP
jgi:hypothetical protein